MYSQAKVPIYVCTENGNLGGPIAVRSKVTSICRKCYQISCADKCSPQHLVHAGNVICKSIHSASGLLYLPCP